MSGEGDTPIESLEQAVDHLQTANKHEDRADALADDAADQLADQIAQELDESYDVIVTPEFETDRTQFSVQILDERIPNALESALATDKVGAARTTVAEWVISDDLVADGVATDSFPPKDRIQNLKGIVDRIEDRHEEGAPLETVIQQAKLIGIDESKAEHEIEKLKQKGEVYEPRTDHLRTT